MARRRKDKALQTRERILDAAIEVFHRRGVARPSLTDVAELAGVTRGAVYGHFENKADMFSALCDRIRLPAETITDADPTACRADPLGELRDSWIFLLRQTATNPQWRRILDIIFHRCELVEETGQIRERMQAGHRNGQERLAELLRKAVSKGQLPADLDIDAAVPLLHGSLYGVLMAWLFQPEAYALAERAEHYVDAILDMLRLSPSLRRGEPA